MPAATTFCNCLHFCIKFTQKFESSKKKKKKKNRDSRACNIHKDAVTK